MSEDRPPWTLEDFPEFTRWDRLRWWWSARWHLRPWNPHRWYAPTNVPTEMEFGHTDPLRCWLQRCARCHKVRLFGKFCEVYFGGGWHHECPDCVLTLVEEQLEKALAGVPSEEA